MCTYITQYCIVDDRPILSSIHVRREAGTTSKISFFNFLNFQIRHTLHKSTTNQYTLTHAQETSFLLVELLVLYVHTSNFYLWAGYVGGMVECVRDMLINKCRGYYLLCQTLLPALLSVGRYTVVFDNIGGVSRRSTTIQFMRKTRRTVGKRKASNHGRCHLPRHCQAVWALR